eukprot:1883532-Alexandrium_andersonii.AAC.1
MAEGAAMVETELHRKAAQLKVLRCEVGDEERSVAPFWHSKPRSAKGASSLSKRRGAIKMPCLIM